MRRKGDRRRDDSNARLSEMAMAEMREDAKAVFERLDSTSALLKALVAEADAEHIGANPGQAEGTEK